MDDAADDAELVERDGKRSHDVEGFNCDFDVGGLLLVTIFRYQYSIFFNSRNIDISLILNLNIIMKIYYYFYIQFLLFL